MNEHLLTKLVVGAGFPLSALAVSHATLNAYLQSASLVVGLVVGILTALSFFKNKK